MKTLDDLKEIIKNETMLVLYFSNEACNVCKVLKPKIIQVLEEQYSQVKFLYLDVEKYPEIAGQYRVFAIPTIDIYIKGKEHARFSRNLILHEFEAAIERPYEILFGE